MDESRVEMEEATEIQNYLASFHKEIEGEDLEDSESENELEEHLSDEDCSNTNLFEYNAGYEIDKSPRKRAEIVRLGSNPTIIKASSTNLSDMSNEKAEIPAIGEELHIDDKRALEMVAQFAEQAVAQASQDSALGPLGKAGAYQTVTIVPSDTNPGELSYVVFVSEPSELSDKHDLNMNMSLYDMNDSDPFNETYLTEQVASNGIKMRTIRLSAKRTQLVTQQHVCSYCSYTSPKRYLLSRHMKSHSEERPHKCGVCERGFKTLASLQNHVNTHTGTRPHPCKECNSCFTTSGELVRHIRYKHTHEKPHKCTECDYASVELSKLKRHMRCHTGERPYQCPHCTYASPDTYKLKRHLRIHTGEKPYECDICQTRFTQSNSLKAHKHIHSGNKPVFHCEYCPATCGRKTDLRIHMEKLHSSDNPHRCKRCGKVFLDRYSYKIHVRSHDGEKCFKCDLCNYASVSQRHLETHMLVHTDQKPFQCDECEQSFRQKQLLKRHKNVYHNPDYVRPEPKEKTHTCGLCPKAFRHKGNLLRHYAIHDPDATASEREVALRLGQPKLPGELEDGEENEDYDFDKDNMNIDDDNQQVVVFEVIQLPPNGASSNQSVTTIDGHTLMLNGGEPQEYSIIEPADETSADFLDFPDSVSDSDDVESLSSLSTFKSNVKLGGTSPKKRNSSFNKSVVKLQSLKNNSRNNNQKFKQSIPQKPSLTLKGIAEKEKSCDTQSQLNFVEGLQKEKDLHTSRGLQAEKDFEECFGFDVKDEDLMQESESTGYQVFQNSAEEIS
ncbi:transcriptional repressor CTCF-like [Uloborus diversus]|uniref:transcriptional repressor CTCF-like n=1 Tax=Uloborus diversus TaxID=327109 RepID=UPI00240A4C83|nr:transcriptional repressor CTCF-like [Uloborus diversus]